MAVRPDVRLEDGPMVPVTCRTCGVRVEARKSSWDQTSIQWEEGGETRCLERRAAGPRPGVNGSAFLSCAGLSSSVREAALAGALPVQDPREYRTNEAREGPAGHGA